ncbi:fatty acid hydroxylase [Colletotrichum higginsianum]|nr:fatty acid hydroxylase [Colletotrichum higginsianum]
MAAFWNSTVVFPNHTSTQTYLGVLDDVNKYNVQLNIVERLWAAWYLWMQNDILATGIMTFVMHEVVYFGRSLPWIIIDAIPYFRRWKLQQVSLSLHSPPPILDEL